MKTQDETEPIQTTFELNDTLYAKADIPATEEVYIWLGVWSAIIVDKVDCADNSGQANVMLSYPIDEAETLLAQRLSTAKTSLANCEEDLDFLREQITVRNADPYTHISTLTLYQTMEVAIARVYNWDVVQKRKDKADEEKEKQKGKEAESSPNK
jgi:hypothetical protein